MLAETRNGIRPWIRRRLLVADVLCVLRDTRSRFQYRSRPKPMNHLPPLFFFYVIRLRFSEVVKFSSPNKNSRYFLNGKRDFPFLPPTNFQWRVDENQKCLSLRTSRIKSGIKLKVAKRYGDFWSFYDVCEHVRIQRKFRHFSRLQQRKLTRIRYVPEYWWSVGTSDGSDKKIR